MADSANDSIPLRRESLDDSSTRDEDASVEATLPDPVHPTIPPQSWSFNKLNTQQEDTSLDAPPLSPTLPNSAFDSDTMATADAEHADVEDAAEAEHTEQTEAAEEAPQQPDSAKYKVRTCRICFDEVAPTFEPVTTTTQLLRQRPRVVYVSEDPDCGRLMRPCKCKGTQQYVHEGCLRAWRMAAGADRNLWKCPTCLYEYKLNRLSWGAWVSSTAVRAALTLLIMVVCIFLLGFIADPIIRCANPLSLLADFTVGLFEELEDFEDWIPDEQPDTWSWHFTRGFFALGFIGMFKSVLTIRPWAFPRLAAGGGRRRGGRDRMNDISWVMILIGVAMFLRVVWNAVSALCSRALDRFSDTIIDVPEEADEDEDEDVGPQPERPQADASREAESRKDQ